MNPPRKYRGNLTAWAIYVVRANWMLIDLRRLIAANEEGPRDEPEAA